MGHIKFWRMSSTFTGLKLQGYLGKFGSSELTDIVAFIQLPDGKVLSSTEAGNLLLWDGGMIKCEISAKGKKSCHQGRIETILIADSEVITAGEDGYLRVWDLETIDNADVTGNGRPTAGTENAPPPPAVSSVLQPRIFEMEPIEEILIAKDVMIRSVLRVPGSSSNYLIHDQQGFLMKLDLNKRSVEKVLSFHAGAIAGVDTSPRFHKMASLGVDGSLRFYDYTTRSLISKVYYPQGGSAMRYLPQVPLVKVRSWTLQETH
jgi:WD40 repeat protein